MKKVFTYRRISSREKRNNSMSIDAQLDIIKRDLSKRGLKSAADFVDDGVSGSVPLGERPAGKRMLEAAQGGNVEIIASALDRLFRDSLDGALNVQLFRRQGIDMVTVREGAKMDEAFGRFQIGILNVVSQFERELVGERMKASNAAKRSRGLVASAKVPYGWKAVGATYTSDGRRSGGKLRRDEKEQAVLVRIKQLRDAGLSLRAIAKQLEEEGIPSRTGKTWSHIVVQDLLRNFAERTRQTAIIGNEE